MSLGKVLVGLAGIALGVKQIQQGASRLRAESPREGFSSGTGQRPGVRLRTYQIRNLDDRIVHLRKLVEQGKRDPVVYEFARKAVNSRCGKSWCTPEKDNLAEAEALFKAIRGNVRYTSDIAGIDSYQKPAHTLRFRTADCDDYAILACASAASLGLPCRFKVIRTKGANDWNHIYAQIGLPRRSPSKWIPFDASVNMPFGWEAPASMVAASRVFPL